MTAGQPSELAALHRLSHLYNVQTSYFDLAGTEVQAGADSLLAALRGLGAPLAGFAEVEDVLRAREAEVWEGGVEPVLVAWDGRLELDLRLPLSDASGAITVELDWEKGGVQVLRFGLTGAGPVEREAVAGTEYGRWRQVLDINIPAGYHALRLQAGARRFESFVIAAPRRAYTAPAGRRWGVFLPLYALHASRSWGIGDFTDLRELIGWASRSGAGFVATLPLLASFLEEPFEPSPYVPVSRLFWNEIYIDPEAAATALKGSLAQDHVVPVAAIEDARRLNARDPVPFPEVMGLKRRVLEQITRPHFQGPTANEVGRGLDETRPALNDYAAFRAAVERLGPSWRAWPEQQRSGALSAADYDAAGFAYHAFAQQEAARQITGLSEAARQRGVRLYLDLPVGVHPDGYDAWRYQGQFVGRMNVGAPPDLLAPDGQNWGFAPLNPEALRRNRFEYVRAYIRHHLSAAGILRIDHAIGLHRLFWIPEGAGGREGVFVRQPAEEVYAILSLESHRAQAVLVGENLGLVPREVDEGLAEHGVAGMYVQLFAMTGDPGYPLKAPPAQSVASFGTHDLPPFTAYWTDEDLEERRRIGMLTPEGVDQGKAARAPEKHALLTHLRDRGLIGENADAASVYRGSTRLLAESDSEWVLLNLEDTWGETRSQNVPGTMAGQHPNWTRRAGYGLEQIEASEELASLTEMLRDIRPGPKEETLDRG